MNIIFAQFDADVYEPVDIWDEYTIDENGSGYYDKVQQLMKYHKGDVRILQVDIADSTIEKLFQTPVAAVKVVGPVAPPSDEEGSNE